MDQIDTITFNDYTTDEIYFYVECVYTTENDMILKCYALYRRQFLQMINVSLHCVKIQSTDIIWIYLELLHSFIKCILSMNNTTWHKTKTQVFSMNINS